MRLPGRLYGGKDFECVHKKSRGFFLPDYARPESVRVFCSVWVRGAGHEDLSGVLSIGGVLFIFFFFFFNPIELLGLWLEEVLVSGS